MQLATKPCDITHVTLGMLLHYLGKLKFKFSPDVEENAHRLHFESPLTLLFIHKF